MKKWQKFLILPNYHLVETIAAYDSPNIRGVTGMRDYGNKRSSFCNAKTAIRDLEYIASNAKFKYLVLSYNSEGIMPQKQIISMLSKYGNVVLEEFEYLRFKSNNNGLAKTKKHIKPYTELTSLHLAKTTLFCLDNAQKCTRHFHTNPCTNNSQITN